MREHENTGIRYSLTLGFIYGQIKQPIPFNMFGPALALIGNHQSYSAYLSLQSNRLFQGPPILGAQVMPFKIVPLEVLI